MSTVAIISEEDDGVQNNTKRVAKNTIFLYARMAITVFISLYVTRLLLGNLGTEDFGIYNLVAGMVAMLVFLNSAMSSATQRFMSHAQGMGNTDRQKKIFNISLTLHFFIAFIVVLLIELVGVFLFDSILDIPMQRIIAAKYVFHFMVVSTFFSIVSVPYDAVINAHENMLFVALTGVLEVILKLTIAILIMYCDKDKLISYGLLMASLAIFMLFIKSTYCHKKYIEVEVNVVKFFDLVLFKEMSRFASWSLLGSSTSMLTNYGLGIVLNVFFGPIVNAAQAVANQINGQLMALATTMLKALNPLIVRTEGEGNRLRMLKTSLLGCKLSFYLLVIFYVPMIIEMPYIFDLWLDTVPEYAVVFCRILLFKCLIEQLYIPLNTSVNAVGDIKNYQISNSILNLFPLCFSYLLFNFGFPAYSAYCVFLVYAFCGGLVTYFFAKKYCGLTFVNYFNSVIKPCLSVFVISFTISIIPNILFSDGIFRLFLNVIIGFFAFVMSVWVIGLTKDEKLQSKGLLLGLFKRIRKKISD